MTSGTAGQTSKAGAGGKGASIEGSSGGTPGSNGAVGASEAFSGETAGLEGGCTLAIGARAPATPRGPWIVVALGALGWVRRPRRGAK